MAGEVTRWLEELRAGDPAAVDQLVPLLYDELRAVARRRLRSERRDHTLDTTALVHETYFKLERQRRIPASDRAEFLAIAGHTMRRILVDHARTRSRKKRGGGERALPLDDVEPFLTHEEAQELVTLDEALSALAKVNPEGAEVVQHRFFGGLTLGETAKLQGTSVKSVQRKWVAARAWLRKEIGAARDGVPTRSML